MYASDLVSLIARFCTKLVHLVAKLKTALVKFNKIKS